VTIAVRAPEAYHYTDPLEFVSAWLAFSRGDELPLPTNHSAELLRQQAAELFNAIADAILAQDPVALTELTGRGYVPSDIPQSGVGATRANMVTSYRHMICLNNAVRRASEYRSLFGSLPDVLHYCRAYSRVPVRIPAAPRLTLFNRYHHGGAHALPGVPENCKFSFELSYIPYRCRSARVFTKDLADNCSRGFRHIAHLPCSAAYMAIVALINTRTDWESHLTDAGREAALLYRQAEALTDEEDGD